MVMTYKLTLNFDELKGEIKTTNYLLHAYAQSPVVLSLHPFASEVKRYG